MAADPSPATTLVAGLDVRSIGAGFDAGELSSTDVVVSCLRRIDEIDRDGPTLRTVIEADPDAVATAERLDAERSADRPRGPLHGVPVLVKDNIDTADGTLTTAGSLALAANRPVADAPLITRLRDAGAILLGKANLSEWANFRCTTSTWAWSARGGLALNPHALDRSAGGSSSGPAAAVAAGLAPIAVGTETDGSIVCPAALCGVVGIKPTVGLIPRGGIVPISHSQDTAGPIARSVHDAALLLGVLAGHPSASHYTRFCTTEGVSGLRVGLPRRGLWGYSRHADHYAEQAVRVLAGLGVEIVDPADLPSIDALGSDDAVMAVMSAEFRTDLEAYLAGRGPETPATLAELVEFNKTHAATEMPYFGQDRFERLAALPDRDDATYRAVLAESRRLSRTDGIDAALGAHELDALVMPAFPPAGKVDLVNGDHLAGGCSSPSAMAGYPLVTVPSGVVDGLPVGVAFAGTASSEPTLIKLAYVVERALGLNLQPTFRSPCTG